MIKPRILFVENDQDYLDTMSEWLERAGYQVFKAISVEEAQKVLNDQVVHLAVIDKRLQNNNDPRDISGLLLIENEAYRSIPKTILTNFPDFEHARQALKPRWHGLPPAVEFLDKRKESEEIIQAIHEALSKYSGINESLIIQVSPQFPFPYLVQLMKPEIDIARLPNHTEELETLFRRLFYQNQQITISRLLAAPNQTVLLAVSAFSEDGSESQFVVAGSVNLKPGRSTPKIIGEMDLVEFNTVETVHFTATAYKFTGQDLAEIMTLSQLYQQGSLEGVKIKYKKVLVSNEEKSLDQFLMAYLELEKAQAQRELEDRLQQLCQKAIALALVEADSQIFTLINPLVERIMSGSIASAGLVPGRLSENSILVDPHGRTWLIDFAQLGEGWRVDDFVALELALKFNLFAKIPDWCIWAQFETELMRTARSEYDAGFTAWETEVEIKKALLAINQVRKWAKEITGCDLLTYEQTLSFYTVARLFTYDPKNHYPRRDLMNFFNNFISATIVMSDGRLNLGLSDTVTDDSKILERAKLQYIEAELPASTSARLWVDESRKEVWLEDQLLPLTSAEYELLLVLYHHANKICTLEEISHELYPSEKNTSNKIVTTMSRLRQKIELTPRHPKYIKSIRGKGYRLDVDRVFNSE